MTAVLRAWSIVALFAATGCGSGSTTAPVARPARVRVELSTIPDVADVPRLMAVDAMRSRGYSVDAIAFADTTATVLALERGELDFANVSDLTAWRAIQKGMPIVAVIDDSRNPNILAATRDIATCADLNGKRVAIQNLAGSNTTVLNRYVEQHCPGTKPRYLVMAGAPTRLAGVLAGELDAAIMELADLDNVDIQQHGKVVPLVIFAEAFPGLTTLSHFTRRELIHKHPDTVKDWLRAMLEARRRIQDARVLEQELVTRLHMTPDVAHTTAVTYLARAFWDVNGRFTAESVQQNIDFMATTVDQPLGVKAADVADLTLLHAVLDEIGRK